MSLFDDIINYELCFPGAVTGSTEVECPHCGELDLNWVEGGMSFEPHYNKWIRTSVSGQISRRKLRLNV